ncbi:hypothetical protein GCM10022254_01800 [Actinomadura meridiana]|uniref:Uncharacterized protein n=1 Tax=Actinomadura meridiana TaxID=559626 RepID=A0ABP8BSD6_9ACTN
MVIPPFPVTPLTLLLLSLAGLAGGGLYLLTLISEHEGGSGALLGRGIVVLLAGVFALVGFVVARRKGYGWLERIE